MFTYVSAPEDTYAWRTLIRKAYETESWALGEKDSALWRKSFGSDFNIIVAYDCDRGQPVGCICSALFGHRKHHVPTVIIGLFFVVKEFRGRGIGNTLFERIVSRYPKNNLYLNGVPRMMEKYRIHHGFSILSEWNNICYQVKRSCLRLDVLTVRINQNIQIQPITKSVISDIISYDDEIQNGLIREKYIANYVLQNDAVSLVALEGSEVVGYGVARTLFTYEYMIGPLYANSTEIACSVLLGLLQACPTKVRRVHFLCPSVNLAAISLIHELSQGTVTSDCVHVGQSTRYKLTAQVHKVFSGTEYDLSFI